MYELFFEILVADLVTTDHIKAPSDAHGLFMFLVELFDPIDFEFAGSHWLTL